MIKKVCILASLSQKSDIEEAVARIINHRDILLIIQPNSVIRHCLRLTMIIFVELLRRAWLWLFLSMREDLVNRLHTSWLLQNTWAYQGRNTIRLKENEFGGEIHERCC